jgi:GNAT superfamily N-acetyltransferase
MSVSCRPIHFGSADYEQAFQLRDQQLRQPLGLRLDAADRADDEEQLHYGLFSDHGQLLATVTVDPLDRQRVKIRQMVVAPGYQGQGLGRMLLKATEAALIAAGFRHAALNARLTAVPFYQHLGYRANNSTFIKMSIPHQRMEKVLAQDAP